MKKWIHILYITFIVISFFIGAGSMYLLIESRYHMRYGIMIDPNHDFNKFGVNTGKDYSPQNPYNYVPIDWLAKEVDYKELISYYVVLRSPNVIRTITYAKEGKFKIYKFSSPIAMWWSLTGVEGYCVVDTSKNPWKVITGFITLLN